MSLQTLLAFDEFELRLDSGELFREGSLAAHLQPQPARLLELLASRAGEVVSREEIRELVWGESFVDFDASLNFCVKQLRRALGDSATAPRYIETLPRRGYRFLRPVRSEPGEKPAEHTLEAMSLPARVPPLGGLLGQWRLLTGLAATLAGLIVLVLLIGSRSEARDRKPRLSVLPLDCQANAPAARQTCGGITDALTMEIARRFAPWDVEVVGATSAQVYQESGKDDRDIGRKLGATHLLTGTVTTSSGRLRIAAKLSRSSGVTLWRQDFEGALMDTQGLYEQIAQQVAKTLKLTLPVAPAAKAPPSQAASEAYLQGKYLRSQWKFDEAVKRLNEAVLLAPTFAPAFAELALASPDRGVPPRQDAPIGLAAAQRALDLDPQLPEAHLAMAEVLFKDLVDMEEAGAHYRQALVLSPRNSEILHDYATYLITLGRNDEALEYAKRSLELDPGATFITSDYGWFLFVARHYEEAIRQARITLELIRTTEGATPAPIANFGKYWSHQVLIFAALKMGDERGALTSGLDRMKEIGKGAEAPRIQSMHEFLERRHQLIAGLDDLPGKTYVVAQAAATSGRIDEALSALEHECRVGGESMMFNFVAVDPLLDTLHGDPRFAKVVDCTRLPQDAPARLALQLKIAAR